MGPGIFVKVNIITLATPLPSPIITFLPSPYHSVLLQRFLSVKVLVNIFTRRRHLPVWILWKLSRNIVDSSIDGARPRHIFLILRFHHRSNNTKWRPLVTYPLQSSAFSLIRQFTYKDCTAVQIPNSPICKKRNTPPPRLAPLSAVCTPSCRPDHWLQTTADHCSTVTTFCVFRCCPVILIRIVP